MAEIFGLVWWEIIWRARQAGGLYARTTLVVLSHHLFTRFEFSTRKTLLPLSVYPFKVLLLLLDAFTIINFC